MLVTPHGTPLKTQAETEAENNPPSPQPNQALPYDEVLVLTYPSAQPLDDRVIIQPDVRPSKTASGKLYLPQNAGEQPARGTVVAVGPGKDDRPLRVVVNDRVIYGKFSGSDYNENDVEFKIMRENDILAILPQ